MNERKWIPVARRAFRYIDWSAIYTYGKGSIERGSATNTYQFFSTASNGEISMVDHSRRATDEYLAFSHRFACFACCSYSMPKSPKAQEESRGLNLKNDATALLWDSAKNQHSSQFKLIPTKHPWPLFEVIWSKLRLMHGIIEGGLKITDFLLEKANLFRAWNF